MAVSAILLGFWAMQGVSAAASGCNSPTLCDNGVVPALGAKLRQARNGGEPVHILQIGDSHTAGDTITNGLRTRLQARYGNGGRGVLAAGKPYRGYLTFGVTASESEGWISNVIFGNRWQPGGPALGLSGFTRTARAANEYLGVATDSSDYDFNRAVICALTGPGQGAVSLRMGTQVENWSLEAARPGAACRTLNSRAAVANASITTLDERPVSITSFATFRDGGGVIVSNVGVVGAQLEHFGRTDPEVLRQEFQAYHPDMIVLAYGTNEGFSPRLTAPEYEAVLRAQVARIRRFAGRDVPIMLLGAPDAASRSAGMGASCGAGWYTPNLLDGVRSIQRRVARELRLGFWDWEQAMGGRCASQSWLGAGLMRSDMVHFTREGGDRIGAMLFADIERVTPAAAVTTTTRPSSSPLPVAPRTRPDAPTRRPSFTHPGQSQGPSGTARQQR